MPDHLSSRNSFDPRRWFQFRIRSLLILTLLVGLGLFAKQQWDWYQRAEETRNWLTGSIPPTISPVYADTSSPQFQEWLDRNTVYAIPPNLSKEEQLAGLVFGAVELPDVERRTAALKIIVEQHPDDRQDLLRHIVDKTRFHDTRALAIRLLGLHRDWNDIDMLATSLDHKSVEVRAAAMEAIGVIRLPSYPMNSYGQNAATTTKPRIDVNDFDNADYLVQSPPSFVPDRFDLQSQLRGRVEAAMLYAVDPEERTAAARALIAWPPREYNLRIAEWGVWINVDGELKLAQTIIDEIPDFVHRLGAPNEPLARRIVPQIMIVTKPILHVTTDVPLAVDVSVKIAEGRAWFAYPMPDDYSLTVGSRMRYMSRGLIADDPAIESFAELGNDTFPNFDNREGYPWLLPRSLYVQRYYARQEDSSAMGVRWQSLIVSPERLPWMQLPTVNEDPRFAWWETLRRVPCAYVSSRGEAERFLYYDGPTKRKSPVIVTDDRENDRLTIRQQLIDGKTLIDNALLIEVDDHVRIARIDLKGEVTEVISQFATESDEAVEPFLGRQLEELGLSSAEATGLVRCWKPQWLETRGRRLLVMFDKRLYDKLCPIEVRPEPTEIARVGIVMTELTPD